ncbi:MAG TPA: CPBP family intramembrane glutamic endopeptidase, partial [Gemmatimonadaceae bacterium]|nr:CPBP family intramembrane glutamic endopeptidase [Gemmatimonadaceae bacterium]
LFVLAGLAASNVAVPLVAMTLPAASMPWLRPTLECLAVLAATRYATATIDGTGWSAVGLGPSAWKPLVLLVAALAGGMAIAVPTALLIMLGDLTFVPAPWSEVGRTLAMSVAVLAPAALTEELLMRGYPFSVLAGTWGWPAATGITAVVFGALHLQNPGVSATAIASVIAAGIFLAGVRVLTGSLAAAWAAHFAWNWSLAGGFHAAVSGLPFGTPGYKLLDSGPDWRSGGPWGPEGGVFAALGMMGALAGLSWAMPQMRRAGILPAAPALANMNADGRDDRQEQQA